MSHWPRRSRSRIEHLRWMNQSLIRNDRIYRTICKLLHAHVMKPVSLLFTLDFRSIAFIVSRSTRAIGTCLRWVCVCASACVWMCVAYCLFWNRQRWHLVDNGIPMYYWQLIAFSLHYAEQQSSSAARFIRFSRQEFAFNGSIILNSFINSVHFCHTRGKGAFWNAE